MSLLSLSLSIGGGHGGLPSPDAPTILSSDTASVAENTTLSHSLSANQAVSWSIVSGADQAKFEISGSTLRWLSNGVKDYETPDDSGTNNTYVVTIRATNGAMATTDQTITVTVTDQDEIPNAFTFTDVTGATTSTDYESNTITVAGLGSGVSTPVSVSGGQYSKNGGSYTSSAGTAQNGDTFAVRHTSSASNSTAVNTTLTIGGVSDTFTSTTEAALVIPSGFTLNGSTNTALKAMLAANSGKIVWVGDSLSCGADNNAAANYGLSGGAAKRMSKRVADKLVARGYNALDNGFRGDNGTKASTGGAVTLAQYDTRITTNNFDVGGTDFAGGAYTNVNGFSGAGDISLTLSGVDRFVVDIYNNSGGTANFLIDGATPGSGPTSYTATSTNAVISRTIECASVGTHTCKVSIPSGIPLVCGIRGYNSSANTIQVINNAASGAKLVNQSSSGSNISARDVLGYDAPNLTIIAGWSNDAIGATSNGDFDTQLGNLIDTAKVSGDVLVAWAPAWDPASANDAAQAAYKDRAAALAASKGVAFWDQRAEFGTYASNSSHSADGVHWDATFQALQADAFYRCILAMAA